MAEKDFQLGDLVWAKMKNYPFWPAQIIIQPEEKSTTKKNQHYVFFYGSRDRGWVLDENIVPHSEEMLNKVPKKAITSLKKGIKQIIKASRGEDSAESDESTESPKINRKKRGRTCKRNMKRRKMTKSAQKPDALYKELSSVQNTAGVSNEYSARISDNKLFNLQSAAGVSNDYSAPISNTSNNIDFFCNGLSEQSGYEYFPALDYPTPSLEENLCETTSKKIGFIGLGAMGSKIVKKLLNSKHNVSIWNRTPDKCEEFVTVGARQYNTPAELVWNCDIIFCCVSGSEAVKAIIFGDCGILHGLEQSEPGSKGYIELTSMNHFTSLKNHAAITDKGGKYLEAPISDSISLEEKGLRMIYAAGDRQLVNDCVSCFLAIAERICFMNCEVGAASKINIALSMLKGNSYALLAESVAMHHPLDLLKWDDFLDVLCFGQMNSIDLLQKYQAMVDEDFTANTSLKYLQKNLELALQIGRIYKQPLPMTSIAHRLYKTATGNGYLERDMSAFYLAKLKVDLT